MKDYRSLKIKNHTDRGGDKVRTRMSRREFELREAAFGDLYPNRDYSRSFKWGAKGGRPKRYQNQAERQKAYRLRVKLSSGIGVGQGRGVRPSSYKYHADRPASVNERVRKFRAKRKLAQLENSS